MLRHVGSQRCHNKPLHSEEEIVQESIFLNNMSMVYGFMGGGIRSLLINRSYMYVRTLVSLKFRKGTPFSIQQNKVKANKLRVLKVKSYI